MEIAYLRKVLGQFHWIAQVTYDSEKWGEDWTVDLQSYAMAPHYDIRGIGRGISYLAARDRAIKNSHHPESIWSRLFPELDQMVYEATKYQVPEVPA